MLLELRVENFKSIHKPIILSMVATADPSHQDFVWSFGPYRVLPTAIIVGPNGAGKSNLFQSLHYLVQLISGNVGKHIPFHPHVGKEDEPSSVQLQFLMEDIRYVYGISVDRYGVREEYLLKVEEEEVVLFEREESVLTCGEEVHPIDRLNLGFRYLADEWGDKDLKVIRDFIVDDFEFLLPEINDEQTLLTQAEQEFRGLDDQTMLSQLIRRLHLGIKDVRLEEDGIMVVYDRMTIPLREESTGTKRLFMLLTLISHAVQEGKTLIIDELERNLHVELTRLIIQLFNHRKTNPLYGQLIFSSHNTHLLNLELFRQDQIWFMEKNLKALETELYSLYNFKDVLEDEDIEHGYVHGKYGATFRFNFDEVVKDNE